MIILDTCQPSEVIDFSRHIFKEYGNQSKSFEEIAELIVKALYTEFCLVDGSPLFRLLRIFRYGVQGDVHPALQSLTTPDVTRWITLMATIGVEPAWCSRHTSEGHQVIPADAPATPMLKAAFSQIGLSFGQDAKVNTLMMHDDEDHIGKFFYVADAVGSPHIPVQKEFVEHYQIRSVIGVGGPFLGGASYFCLGFSRAPISEADATKFAGITPYLGTLLAKYNDKQIWK